MDLYVSPRGDNTDGLTWDSGLHTIQAALDRVPPGGGHRVLVRPDTYAEANLRAADRGAAGAYNELVGDFDGALGSGATGWVVIDSGAPEVIVRTQFDPATANPDFELLDGGDPRQEWGHKSVDWWGTCCSSPSRSGSIWDRWRFRHLYAAGSEGGVGWDMVRDEGCEFSAEVEHCVGLGRFAGACAIAHTSRSGEPVIFRDCWLMNLDTWGDCGGVYVRGQDATMPDTPHALFVNCTITSPKKALQSAWPGVDQRYTRVAFRGCRLITLNMTQPRGEPACVISCGSENGSQLHVDLEDTLLVGYEVFGGRSRAVSYSLKGRVQAYVEYEQPVPAGMERLRFWPVEAFSELLPPR